MKVILYSLILALFHTFSYAATADHSLVGFEERNERIPESILQKWGSLSSKELLILQEKNQQRMKELMAKSEALRSQSSFIESSDYSQTLCTLQEEARTAVGIYAVRASRVIKEKESLQQKLLAHYKDRAIQNLAQIFFPRWRNGLYDCPTKTDDFLTILSFFPESLEGLQEETIWKTFNESSLLPTAVGLTFGSLPMRGEQTMKGSSTYCSYTFFRLGLEFYYNDYQRFASCQDPDRKKELRTEYFSQERFLKSMETIRDCVQRSGKETDKQAQAIAEYETTLQVALARKLTAEEQLSAHMKLDPDHARQEIEKELDLLHNEQPYLPQLLMRRMDLNALADQCKDYGVLTIKGDHERCAVCLDNFVDEVESHKVRVNPCKHMFHHDCVKSLVTCPSCRGPLPGNLTHIGKESTEQTPIFLLSGSHPTVPATTLEGKLSQLEASYQNQSSAVRTQISLLLKKYLDKKHTLLTCEATEAIQLQSPMAAMLQTMEDRPLDSLPGFYHDQQQAFIKTVSPEVQLQLPISLMIATGDALIDLHAEQSVFTKLRTQYLRLKTRLLEIEKIQDQ